MTRRKR